MLHETATLRLTGNERRPIVTRQKYNTLVSLYPTV